jgi:hypothetical protein
LTIKQGYLTILAFSVELTSCLIPLKVKKSEKVEKKILKKVFNNFFSGPECQKTLDPDPHVEKMLDPDPH